MGTITIKVPKDIEAEYELDSMEQVEKLIQNLNGLRVASLPLKSDSLMGLFAEEAELMDQLIESAMKSREQDPLRIS